MSETKNIQYSGEDEKLNRFIKSVQDEAYRISEEITADAEKRKSSGLAEEEQKTDREVASYIIEETEKLEAKYKQAVSKISFDGKRSLLLKREEILNSVFDDVKNSIEKYTQTEEYRDHLIDTVKRAKESINGVKAVISICPRDTGYKELIASAWGPSADVAEDANIQYGGVIITSRDSSIVIDETLDRKLEEEKNSFIKTSGLYFG